MGFFFWIVVFGGRERFGRRLKTERLDVEAPEKYPCPCCMREPMETAPSRTAMDTRGGGLHGQSGHESTDYTQSVVPLCRSMDGLIDVCSNEDEGRSARKTPDPLCGNEQAEIRSKDKDRTTHDKTM